MMPLIGLTAVLLLVTGIIGLIVLSLLWRAWWLYPAWQWFLVPLGVPQISFYHFAAIVYLIGTLTAHTDVHKDDRPFSWSSFVALWTAPVIVWFILRWLR
jgi:hypothetical protein